MAKEQVMSIARILVATDFTKTSADALGYAGMLATRFASELHLLHVVPDARQEPWASEAVALNLDELIEDWMRDAECKLQRIARRLPSALHVRTATRFGPLLDEILTYVEGNQIDLVVLGVTADGKPGGWLCTGIAERVARRSPCLVLTVPDAAGVQTLPAIRSIVIPVDFNRHADEALTRGLAWAAQWGSMVHVLHVYSPPWVRDAGYVPPPAALVADVVRRLEGRLAGDVSRRHAGQLDVRTVVRIGEPAEEILRYAEEIEADLIVVGTHGRELFGRMLLGSVTEAMLRRAPCPVLTLHAGARGVRPAVSASAAERVT
jgi:nucleotide-binding universal stress UspA family protein